MATGPNRPGTRRCRAEELVEYLFIFTGPNGPSLVRKIRYLVLTPTTDPNPNPIHKLTVALDLIVNPASYGPLTLTTKNP